MLILLIPAIYNFYCFNGLLPVHNIILAINGIGFLLIVAVIWFFGLSVFEFITGGVHTVCARKSQLADWQRSLYKVLSRTPLFALLGAVLWAIWLFAVYQLRLGFYTVSVPIGIAAHVLAGCLYVPLIYRWYQVERSGASQTTT